MPVFGFEIFNRSSAEVSLPAPVNRRLEVGKKIVMVVDDPDLILENTILAGYVRDNILVITQVEVADPSVTTTPPFQLVPGPPGPAGPPGSGGGGETGGYTCPLSVAVLNLVTPTGSGSVDQANANAEATMPAIGIVVAKPTGTTCSVQYRGEVTGFVGLTPDTIYYAATTAGSISTTAPSGLGQVVQRVGIARDSTTLVLDIDDFIIL